MSDSLHRVVSLLALVFMVVLAGCAKKPTVAKTVPPPPPAPVPSATIAASPDDLQQGQPAQLTWRTENAQSISISGIGTVAAQGSTSVRPQSSTTYVLTATGPGGSKEASARVTVALAPTAAAKASPTDEELFSESVQDIFFAYDKADVPSNEESAVERDARFLEAHPYMKLLISGHCDERGSEEYNLTLGDGRAGTVASQLERLGVKPDRIRTISYGKEKPFCTEETDACWQMNRRAHFSLQP
jgi:peptidoglycan-associated lipoprotein